MRALRYAYFFLPISYAVVVACATAEDLPATSDAGGDTSLTTPPTSRDGGGGPFDATQPGFDSSIVPQPDAGAPDVDTDAPSTCGVIGLGCDTTNAFSCPGLFLYCEPWTSPFIGPFLDAGDGGESDGDGGDGGDASDAGDAGTSDASADAADAAPPVDAGDGVCLPLPFGVEACNDGSDAGCDGGTCLLAAQRCLTPEQAACICPTHPGACSP